MYMYFTTDPRIYEEYIDVCVYVFIRAICTVFIRTVLVAIYVEWR